MPTPPKKPDLLNEQTISLEQKDKLALKAIEHNKQLQKGVITQQKYNDLVKRDYEMQVDKNKNLQEQIKNSHELHKIAQEAYDLDPGRITNRQALHDIGLQSLETEKAEAVLMLERGDYDKTKYKSAKELYDITLKQIRGQEKTRQGLKQINADTKNLVTASTGISDQWRGTITAQIFSSKENMAEFLKTVTAALNPADLLGSFMMKVQEATMAGVVTFSNATASLNALTGAGGAYNAQIVEIAKDTRKLGVGWSGAAEAIGELHSNMTGFTDLNKSAQTELVKTTVGLSKLGISSSVTAKSMDDLMKGFGMSKFVAENVQKDMAKMAIALGIPPAQMAESFASSMPHLASWGKEAPEIFKKVAGAAKKLGVQMETLLGFSSQFDTFDDAASAVGKLNSILGGDLLNSYEMMNASAEERNEMLLESIELSGRSWDAMNRFEKMAVANAAGITDMNEAQKLFSGGLSAYREGLSVTAASQEELERRQKAAASVTEKLTMLFESFAVAIEPIVSVVTGFVDILMKLGPLLTHVIIPMATAFTFLAGAIKAATIAQAMYTSIVSAGETVYLGYLILKDKLGIVTRFLTKWTWLETAANWAGAKAKAAIAFVSKLLGIGLGVQAGGQKAVETTAPGATAGTASVGTAAWYAVIPIGLIAIGLGLMALGFGLVAIAAAGIIYMMIEFVKLMIESPGAVIQMAGAMSILALSFIGFSISLMGLALILPLIPLVAAGIFAIGLAMRTIPESKTITFATAMSGLAEVATITPATVEGVRGVVEQAAAYLEIQAGFKAPDADAFVQALTKAADMQSQKSGTKGDGKDIVLVLNDREFGRAINVQLNSKHNVATR